MLEHPKAAGCVGRSLPIHSAGLRRADRGPGQQFLTANWDQGSLRWGRGSGVFTDEVTEVREVPTQGRVN